MTQILKNVYYSMQLPWKRVAVSKYLDWLDDERRVPKQEVHSKKGKWPGKQYCSKDISACAAINNLPVALYISAQLV